MTDDVKLTATLDSSGVSEGVSSIKKELGNIPDVAQTSANKITSSFSSLPGLLKSVGTGAGLAIGAGLSLAAVNAVVGLPGSILNAITAGAGLADVRGEFERLAGEIGGSVSGISKDVAEAFGGVRSETEQVIFTNKLLQAGLDPKYYGAIITEARRYADVTGEDLNGALEKLTTNVIAGNDKFLKQIGVVADAESALKAYAKEQGVADSQVKEFIGTLDEQTVQQIKQKSALEAIAAKTKELGGIQNDAGDAVESLSAAVQDVTDQFFLSIGGSESLTTALGDLSGVLLENKDDITDVARAVAGFVADGITLLADALPTVIDGLKFVGSGLLAIGDAASATIGAVVGFKDAILGVFASDADASELVRGVRAVGDAAQDSTLEVAALRNELARASFTKPKDAAVDLALAISGIGKVTKPVAQATENLAESTDKLVKPTRNAEFEQLKLAKSSAELKTRKDAATKAADELKRAQEKETQAIEKANAEYVSLSDSVLSAVRGSEAYQASLKEVEDGSKSASEASELLTGLYTDLRDKSVKLEDAQAKLAKAFLDVREGADPSVIADAVKEVENLEQAIEKVGKVSKGSSGFLSDLFGDGLDLGNIGKGFEESIGSGVQDAFSSVFQDISSGGFDRASIASAGGAIGQALGAASGVPFADQLGSILGSQLGDKLSKIGQDSKSSISAGIALAFPPAGFFSDQIAGYISDSFGLGDSAATQARKSVDEFFASALDANRVSVIIVGKLTEIRDLAFSGNQAGEGLFGTLPAETQTQFQSLGLAIEQSLGIGSELGVGLGSVLANNLGGSLNNVQVLLKRIGLTAEDLTPKIEELFLQGELGATEAATSLNAIVEIGRKGIPGALGATDQAFANFIASSGRGAASIDALGDIVAEAGEKGVTTLAGLRDDLTGSGRFAASEIDKFISILSQQYGEGFLQLEDVSTNAAIQIGAALESVGFSFAPVSDEISTLKQAIDSIPKAKDITFNVRVNATSDDRNLLNAASGTGAFSPQSGGIS